MNILEALHTRRSIRKFTDAPVSDEHIQTILAAGMTAPSAGNAQPWHFVVVNDRQVLDAIPEFHAYAAMCRQATAGILVCGDLSLEKYKGFWVQDCSAATQNILLAAHALGLGAVWTGIYPDEPRMQGARNLFNIPDNIIPFAFVPLGHPDQPATHKNRYNEKRVHKNAWQG